MRIRFSALVVAIFAVHLSVSAQAPPSWTADWIACPNAPSRDEGFFHFRKKVAIPHPPPHLLVEVSADNQFQLFINGRFAGSGPARGDLGHWRYETIDIGGFLRPGENWIGATVWNFGVRSALAQISSRTGFYLNSFDPQYSVLRTDSSWQVERERGIHTLPQAAPSLLHVVAADHAGWFYYAAEPATRTDGTVYDWEWEGSASRGSWRKAISLEAGGPRGASDLHVPWWLVPDTLPAMERALSPAGRVVRTRGISSPSQFPAGSIRIPAHTKVSLLLDNGQLTTAYPELTVGHGKGALIRLTYAEALRDSSGIEGNRNEIAGKMIGGIDDEFMPDGASRRVFEPLVWRTWRYMQLDIQTGSEPLTLVSLRSWFTAYPFVRRGAFEASDASLEKIWSIGWRTARLDAHSTYMDTPYWEQLQYVADTRVQALISYALSGDDRLARQAIDAIDDSRLPDGITLSRAPTSLRQIIPSFSLEWVDMVHDFWMYRDDDGFTRAHLPGTRAVLAWFLARVRPDGMLGALPWWLPDAGPMDGDGGSAMLTLQTIAALRKAADLESALGEPAIAERYRRAAARSADAVRALCWNPDFDLIADNKLKNSYSQEANALAVTLDVIPRDRQREAMENALSATDPAFKGRAGLPEIAPSSYYFRFFLAEALDHAGMGDLYTQMLGPWREMMSLGLTTWAESKAPSRSDSHAWTASPTYDLPTIVAGIRPGSPGFKTVTIEPHLGPLTHLEAAMPHPKGMIAVTFTRQDGNVASGFTLPPGVEGHLLWRGASYPLHGGEQRLTLPDSRPSK